MLNNKGFTIVEVVVSFTFVVIVLASMFAIVINYQDEVSRQESENSLLVFKNSILQIVYDDVIRENMESITTCDESDIIDKCVDINYIKDGTVKSYRLEAIKDEDNNKTYVVYRNVKYELPDSGSGLSEIDKFLYTGDTTNKIYKVTIPVIHAEMTDEENEKNNINIVVSGKKFNK